MSHDAVSPERLEELNAIFKLSSAARYAIQESTGQAAHVASVLVAELMRATSENSVCVCVHVCAHPHNHHVTQATINMLQSKVDSMMILQTEQEEQHKAILALKTSNNGKITVLTDLKSLLALTSI